MGLKRSEGWEGRLYEFLEAASERLFSWADWHCCDFVRACLSVQCEADISVPKCSGKKSAIKLIKSHGGFDQMIETLAADLHLPEIPPLTAKRGDVVMIAEDQKLVGICIGSKIAVVSEVGLIVKSIQAGTRAWQLP